MFYESVSRDRMFDNRGEESVGAVFGGRGLEESILAENTCRRNIFAQHGLQDFARRDDAKYLLQAAQSLAHNHLIFFETEEHVE